METDRQDMGVPPSGSGHSPSGLSQSSLSQAQPSVPNAGDVRLLSAGPDPRGGFTFSFADGVEGGIIHIIAAHLAEMMGLGTEHELNCVQMDVHPRGHPALLLTMQRAGGKSPLALKAEARKLLERTLEAINSGRSEPLYIMRDAIRNWLEGDPASAIPSRRADDAEGGSAGTEGSATGNAGDAQPQSENS